MAQNTNKQQARKKKSKGIFVRGIKPSTKDWLSQQVNPDDPSVPAVIRKIVEKHKRKATRES